MSLKVLLLDSSLNWTGQAYELSALNLAEQYANQSGQILGIANLLQLATLTPGQPVPDEIPRNYVNYRCARLLDKIEWVFNDGADVSRVTQDVFAPYRDELVNFVDSNPTFDYTNVSYPIAPRFDGSDPSNPVIDPRAIIFDLDNAV